MRCRRSITLIAVSLMVLVVAAACGDDSSTSASTATTTTVASAAGTTSATAKGAAALAAACPKKLVLQTDWFPEAEHAPYYNLLDPNGKLDSAKGTYTGTIKGSTVELEIRFGGPFLGQQTVSSIMYQDDSIDMGFVHTDDAVRFSKTLPTVAVVAQLEHSPLAWVWDPQVHSYKTIADVAASKAPILVFTKEVNYVPVLVAKGLVPLSQFDDGFDGSYTRLVADHNLVQQAFITETPYRLEKEIKQFGRPVGSLMINTSGYDPYLSSVSVKKAKLAALSPCLKVFVPLAQQATVDYVKNPTAANASMVDMVTKLNSFWTLSTDFLSFSVEQIKKYDIMSNGPDKTLGNFDTTRVQKIIDEFWTTFGKNVATADTSITPASIADNQFIDTSIGL